MKRSFLSVLAYSNVLWIVGLLLITASVTYHFTALSLNDVPSDAHALSALADYTFLGFPIKNFFEPSFWGYFSRFVILLGIGFTLQYLSTEYRLIRVRSFFPFFLFCLLSGALLPGLPLNGAALACLLLTLSCYRLFRSLDNGLESKAVFEASMLLTIASIFQSRLLWLTPAIWLIMGILQVFHLRSFFASILGVLVIFWMIGGISFLLGTYDFLYAYGQDLIDFQLFSISGLSPSEILYLSFLAVLMVSAIISFWPRQHLDKLRTRNYLNSVLLLWFALLVLWIFSNADQSYMLPLMGFSTLVIAHFFSLVDTLYSRMLFVFLLGLSFAVYFSL